jgi:hypothetical protein
VKWLWKNNPSTSNIKLKGQNYLTLFIFIILDNPISRTILISNPIKMTNEEKGRKYQQLMYDYDLLSNRINSIKGESFELNENQNKQIRELQMRQQVIMNEVNRLLQ